MSFVLLHRRTAAQAAAFRISSTTHHSCSSTVRRLGSSTRMRCAASGSKLTPSAPFFATSSSFFSRASSCFRKRSGSSWNLRSSFCTVTSRRLSILNGVPWMRCTSCFVKMNCFTARISLARAFSSFSSASGSPLPSLPPP